MTQEEITAKEIGENLYGALSQLNQAKRLISETEHSIAWGATEMAISETKHAIAMMKQDYANMEMEALSKSKFILGDAVYFYTRRNEYIPGSVQGIYPNGDIAVDANFPQGDHVVSKRPHEVFHQEVSA